MPTQGTQVYWHQLPEKRPPWRNIAELRACIQESKRAVTSALQTPWKRTHNGGRKQQRLMTEQERIRRDASRQRNTVVRQLENPRIHRGVVPEPNATPLRVVNLIMTHLGQRAVSYAEADAAVAKVLVKYNTLTQQSQPQAGPTTGGGEGGMQQNSRSNGSTPVRRGRRPSHRKDPVTTATASVLSQTQPTGTLNCTQPTSSQIFGKPGAGLTTDMQNSLLLDVVGELCGSRALRFKRLSRADLGAINWQVTSVEAVPHRRVVLLADRRDPYFVVLFGLLHRVTPEPFVVATLKEEGRTPYSEKRYSRTEKSYTQVFCVAPAPVPWRRVFKNISVSAYRNEFAAAVVEVEAEAEEEGESSRETSTASHTLNRSGSYRMSFMESEMQHLSLQHNKSSSSDFLSGRLRQYDPTVLGDDVEDDEEEEKAVPSPISAALAHSTYTSETTLSSSSYALNMTDIESKWIQDGPMFEVPTPSTRHHGSGLYGDGSAVGEEAGQLDPLQRLPRTDTRDRLANAKLRVWYRRLLVQRMEAELMERLREMHADD